MFTLCSFFLVFLLAQGGLADLLNKDLYNRDLYGSNYEGLYGKSLYNKGLYGKFLNNGIYNQRYEDFDVRSNFLGRNDLDKSGVCPNTLEQGDLNDRFAADLAMKDLMNKLWNNKDLPRLTLLGKRMKNAILHLINSNDALYHRNGFLTSIFFFSYYPHTDLNLDFCPFVKLIDAAVQYKKNNDVGKVLESIDITGKAILDAAQLIGSSVLFYGKCGVVKPDLTRFNCRGDGLVYQFEDIWRLEGGHLPNFYRDLVYELYRSENPVDKLMAVISSAALTPQLYEIVKNWNRYPMFEIVNMLATDNVPSSCCSARAARFQELLSITTQEISRNTLRAKNVFAQ